MPDWYWQYRPQFKIYATLDEAYEYALFHDCGKPYCLTIGEDGKRHFPNHAEISYQTYCKMSNNETIAELIKHDMDIHTLKAEGIAEFCKNKHAFLHLLAGIAEINANAQQCGGFDTTAFKIKFKSISQRGKAICNTLLKENNNGGNYGR